MAIDFMNNYKEIRDEEEYYAREIVDIAIKIHNILAWDYWKVFMKNVFAMN